MESDRLGTLVLKASMPTIVATLGGFSRARR